MSKANDDAAHAHALTRRRLLKGTAAGGVAAVGMGAGDVGELSATTEAEAIGCGGLCIGAVAVGGAAAVGWALREFEVVGGDAPPEGMTTSALRNETANAVQARKSNNASTFIDNENIVDAGLKDSLYSEGKISAIDAINREETQATVESEAVPPVEVQGSTVIKNLLKSWNESVSELESLLSASEAHTDATRLEFFGPGDDWWADGAPNDGLLDLSVEMKTVTLPDGTTFDVKQIRQRIGHHTDNRAWAKQSPLGVETGGDTSFLTNTQDWGVIFEDGDGGSINYLVASDWMAVYDLIDQTVTDVKDGLILWVDSVYSQVQAGEIDTADLATPSELAEMKSSDEDFNQAIADLMALNVPVNLDREAEVHLPNSGTTLYGSLGISGEATLSAGDSIVPSNDSKTYYLTYDASEAHGTWSAVNESVDGGMVTFTEEPHPSVLYTISTGAQETAEVAASDFTDEGDGTYTVDISEQVETAITTVAEVNFYSESETTQMETVILDEKFEIVTFTDSNGEDVSSADYTKPSAPQDDTNYITQEEWDEREKKYQDLIDKYEESQSGGGGLPSFGDFSPREMVVGAVVVGGSILGISSLSS